jgi:hypothetical protein
MHDKHHCQKNHRLIDYWLLKFRIEYTSMYFLQNLPIFCCTLFDANVFVCVNVLCERVAPLRIIYYMKIQ